MNMISLKRKLNITSKEKLIIKSLTFMMTIRTVVFIVFTGPISIAGGYFLNELRESDQGKFTLSVFSTLRFLNHSFNIISLIVFKKKFLERIYNVNAILEERVLSTPKKISLWNLYHKKNIY